MDNKSLFRFIRNTLTEVRNFSQIHYFFISQVKCQKQYHFKEVEIEQNVKDLQKICKISKIPAPFTESQNLLNSFVKTWQIIDKIKRAVQLIGKLKEQMSKYRVVNGMETSYAFSGDDIFAALTYVVWRLGKNIYGVCIYVEDILSCQFVQFNNQQFVFQLNKFGTKAAHSFQTIQTIANIGLLEKEKVYQII